MFLRPQHFEICSTTKDRTIQVATATVEAGGMKPPVETSSRRSRKGVLDGALPIEQAG